MKLMDLNKKAETVLQPIFYLDGIPYLPHYTQGHLWVGPGGEDNRSTYSTTEISEKGRLSVKELWKRSWTEDIKGWRML